MIPQLLERGHTVVGSTTSPSRADALRALGAEPVVLDILDARAAMDAVNATEPEAIVHQATALSGFTDIRKFEQAFALTNRLRTEGLDNLLAAAREAGVERFVAQSYAGHPFKRVGGPVKTEEDPLDDDPPKQLRPTIEAIKHLEPAVVAAGGVALRYGGFYGPGTGLAPGGDQWDAVRARKFPLVGDGGGIWSFTHIEDVASATVAALENWTPGEVYNIVDDEPAPVREWLPALAEAVGAKPPRHVPRWAARLMGAHVVVMMCEIRGASNAKARERLGWTPRWPTWRDGFAALAAGSRPRQDVGHPASA